MEGSVVIKDEKRKELRTIVSNSESKSEMKQSKDKVTVELRRTIRLHCQKAPNLSE